MIIRRTAYNKRVSGFVLLSHCPNPSLSLRTSDTRRTLGEIARKDVAASHNWWKFDLAISYTLLPFQSIPLSNHVDVIRFCHHLTVKRKCHHEGDGGIEQEGAE